MRKKAANVAAASAAGLLALSPLAFVDTPHEDWGDHVGEVASYESTEGLVNLASTVVAPAATVHDDQTEVEVLGLWVPATGSSIVRGLTGVLGVPVAGRTVDVEAECGDACR